MGLCPKTILRQRSTAAMPTLQTALACRTASVRRGRQRRLVSRHSSSNSSRQSRHHGNICRGSGALRWHQTMRTNRRRSGCVHHAAHRTTTSGSRLAAHVKKKGRRSNKPTKRLQRARNRRAQPKRAKGREEASRCKFPDSRQRASRSRA